MTVRFEAVRDFHKLPEDEAKRILYEGLLSACEKKGIQLAPEGHWPQGSRYADLKNNQTTFDVERVQRAFACADSIYKPASEFSDIDKGHFEDHPQVGYVGGGEMLAAMMLKGYPAKFAEEGEEPELRAQFPVTRACSHSHIEDYPQVGYLGGREMLAAMMLRRYPAKFAEEGEEPELRAQFPVKGASSHSEKKRLFEATELKRRPIVREREEILDQHEESELRAQFPVTRACSHSHKMRLFVGEGNFSGVTALLEKHKNSHPNLGKSILATELKRGPIVREREEILDQHNVRIEQGFDATKMHEHPIASGRSIERIHWNCPHDGSSYQAQTLPPIIRDFFASAKRVQQDGHRVHITLAQPVEEWDKSSFYQGVVYNIHDAAHSNGYNLYAKRPFGAERYPGYVHEQTHRAASARGANRLREFVFIKGPLPQDRKPTEVGSKYFPVVSESRPFYVRDTDNESSSYSDSD
ncbi:MAG TPA: Rossmann-like fold-containing protein [Chlamydiales bacterium]|nr:Rossmann-like fold-containing protein [Chlamydiales bacterium]